MSNQIHRGVLRLLECGRREEGQALVEYALLLFLIAVASVTTVKLLGANVHDYYQSIVNQIP